VFLVGRSASRRTRAAVLGAILLASFGSSVYGSYRHPSATFYLLPGRAWELALGSLVCFAALADEASVAARRLARLAPWLGLAAISSALFLYSPATRFPGVAALVPCGGTALVIWGCSRQPGPVGRALSARPLVFVGLISYSLYLWHWPLLVFWKYLQPRPELTLLSQLALAATAVAAASASYYLVELPIRTKRVLESAPLMVCSSVLATIAFVLAGSAIYARHGMPSRLPADCLRLADPDVDPLLFNRTPLDRLRDGTVPLLTGGASPSRTQPVDLLLWGDSHANSVAPVIRALAAEHHLRSAMIVHPATAPLVDFWRAYPDGLTGSEAFEFSRNTMAYVRDHAVTRVVVAAAWEAYAFDETRGRATTVFRRHLARTVMELQTAGADVWLIRDVPSMPFDVPRALSRACITGGDPDALPPSAAAYASEHDAVNDILEALRSSRVHVLDPVPLFTDARGRLIAERNTRVLFMDNSHLTRQGAELLRPLFEPLVASRPSAGATE